MKCLCGYEFGEYETSTSSEKPSWIPIIGSDTYFQVQVKPGSFRRNNISLYACPKCGTVKMAKR